MTETRIKKKQKNSNFTIIDNAVLTNSHLSFRARGILTMLLSLPEDWIVRKGWLYTQTEGEGRQAIDKAWKELTQNHYICLRRVNDTVNGRIHHEVVVSEIPMTPKKEKRKPLKVTDTGVNPGDTVQLSGSQQMGFQQMDSHQTGFQHMDIQQMDSRQLLSTNEQSTNQQITNKQSPNLTTADDEDDKSKLYMRAVGDWYVRVGKALGCYLNQKERAYVKKWIQKDGYSEAELTAALAASELNHGKTVKYIDITLRNARKATEAPALRVHDIPLVDIFHT
ncbi:hypothetical protein EQG49_04385 [Periweissella cryptocerci]|uniref:Helix-turn-helix domain-containing protein n=1 Tax=Periweissella cryptocerci TaxID=2506420 RepID=A0A4P6YSZ6_9LACO|nr:hypothetical protein [Periweissella cryptocerci]QBO35753.1 hypothetical protein EQG49_04385 [Periweissella cryptocerci]